MNALYDSIGKTYDMTRQADPEIIDRICALFAPQQGQQFLDVGCGSGNYTIALAKKGLVITGLDVSSEMIEMARKKEASLTWIQGDAKALPFPDKKFDGLLCFLAIHHIRDLAPFFKEAYRVLKPEGKFLIFTNSPEQFLQLWLVEYFPKMMAKAASRLFSKAHIEEALQLAGFPDHFFETYFVKENTRDAFLELAKHHPKLCLDANFRENTSPFALAPDQNEVQSGLEKLARDIESQKIEDVKKRYPNPDGSFFYCLAKKVSDKERNYAI